MSEFDNQNTPDISDGAPSAPQPEGQPQYTQAPQFDPQAQQPDYSQQPGYNQQSGYGQQPYAPQPPLQQTINIQAPLPPYEPKSKMAAGLLGIFLGSLGVHNFYLGFTGKAVAQLLITLLTCGIGGAISGIWGLIEGIMILTGSIAVDGHGVPMKE